MSLLENKSLNDVIEENNENQENNVSFEVKDLATAAEAQRRITYFKEKEAEIDAIIDEQLAPFFEKIEKIKQWGEEAKKEYVDKTTHYSALLETFIRNEVNSQQESGKKPKKTIKLPYGSIALKKQQPEFIKDEEVLLQYAKSIDLVKVKETTDWESLKKVSRIHDGRMFNEDGEEIPGVTVVERDDKFELKID